MFWIRDHARATECNELIFSIKEDRSGDGANSGFFLAEDIDLHRRDGSRVATRGDVIVVKTSAGLCLPSLLRPEKMPGYAHKQ